MEVIVSALDTSLELPELTALVLANMAIQEFIDRQIEALSFRSTVAGFLRVVKMEDCIASKILTEPSVISELKGCFFVRRLLLESLDHPSLSADFEAALYSLLSILGEDEVIKQLTMTDLDERTVLHELTLDRRRRLSIIGAMLSIVAIKGYRAVKRYIDAYDYINASADYYACERGDKTLIKLFDLYLTKKVRVGK